MRIVLILSIKFVFFFHYCDSTAKQMSGTFENGTTTTYYKNVNRNSTNSSKMAETTYSQDQTIKFETTKNLFDDYTQREHHAFTHNIGSTISPKDLSNITIIFNKTYPTTLSTINESSVNRISYTSITNMIIIDNYTISFNSAKHFKSITTHDSQKDTILTSKILYSTTHRKKLDNLIDKSTKSDSKELKAEPSRRKIFKVKRSTVKQGN